LNKKRKLLGKPFLFFILIFCMLLFASCESGKPASESDNFDIDVADLTMQDDDETEEEQLKSDNFMILGKDLKIPTDFIVPFLNEKFKQVKFRYDWNYVPPFSKGTTDGSVKNIFDVIVSSKGPDLILVDRRTLSVLIEADYLEPIDFESMLNLDPDILRKIRSYAPDLQLYALPLGENKTGLFYNKEIFDDMNVAYPTDNMTWREVIELSRFVSNPGKWSGLLIHDLGIVASQLDISEMDGDPNQLDYSSEPWVSMEHFIESLKGIGGTNERSPRFGNGDAAMYVGPVFSAGLVGPYDKPTVQRWDVVTHPVFDDGHRYAPAPEITYVGIPRGSKQKDIAYEVVRYLLSKEVQTQYMQRGFASYRTDIHAGSFGEATTLANKSVASLFTQHETGPFEPGIVFYHGVNVLHSYAEKWYGTPLTDGSRVNQYIERAKNDLEKDIQNFNESRQKVLKMLGKAE
jgi:ABC-type glycerol-3-phosphate transport system substrate-binding protein